MDKKDLLELPFKMLSLISKQSPMDGWKGKALNIWYKLVMIDTTFGILTYFHYMMSNTNDFGILIEATFSATAGVFAYVKLMTIIWKKKFARALVDDLRNMAGKELDLFLKVDQISNRILKILLGFSIMTIVMPTMKTLYDYFAYSVRDYPFRAS
jgi:hypothetical protein